MNAAQYSRPCYVVLTYVIPKLTRMPPDSVYNQAHNLVRTIQCSRCVHFAVIPWYGSHARPSCWNWEAKVSRKKLRNLSLNLRRGSCRLQCWLSDLDWLELVPRWLKTMIRTSSEQNYTMNYEVACLLLRGPEAKKRSYVSPALSARFFKDIFRDSFIAMSCLALNTMMQMIRLQFKRKCLLLKLSFVC